MRLNNEKEGMSLIDENNLKFQPENITEKHDISKLVSDYINSFYCIEQTVEIVLPHVTRWLQDEIKKKDQKIGGVISKIAREIINDNPTPVEVTSAHEFAELFSSMRDITQLKSNQASEVLSRSLFMQMFSELDMFTGKLLKIFYLRNDDLLKGISREISLKDLLEYRDLTAVKRAILDKEIDTFRRDSYVEQFATLEKKFKVQLKKFDEWPEFVELSQRRNLFTHNGGIVNDQYLAVCERENVKLDQQLKIGDSLTIDSAYFAKALRLISRVGLMLSYTLWKKIFPNDFEEINESLNDIIYDNLALQRWVFVCELRDFALSPAMVYRISEKSYRIRVINIAIALKFSEKDRDATSLLTSLDWTASYRDFKLAIEVLNDNFQEAIKIMEGIGKSGELIEQTSYHTWPLFTKFRECPEFYEAYRRIYGETFFKELNVNSSDDSIAGDRINFVSAEKNDVHFVFDSTAN